MKKRVHRELVNCEDRSILVKLTNLQFDDVIGVDTDREYFTLENNDEIYRKLKTELKIKALPYLGPKVLYGMGDMCIEESDGTFKFYVIDKFERIFFKEFTDPEEAIRHLCKLYKRYGLVKSADKMADIILDGVMLGPNHEFVVRTLHKRQS